MGNFELSIRDTADRRAGSHSLGWPSGDLDQSWLRIIAPRAPPPDRNTGTLAAGVWFIEPRLGESKHCRSRPPLSAYSAFADTPQENPAQNELFPAQPASHGSPRTSECAPND